MVVVFEVVMFAFRFQANHQSSFMRVAEELGLVAAVIGFGELALSARDFL
jgi:hypothetical protein